MTRFFVLVISIELNKKEEIFILFHLLHYPRAYNRACIYYFSYTPSLKYFTVQ